MNRNLKLRIMKEANYIFEKKCTIRYAAKKFNVSKSTVHKDMQERLKILDMNMYKNIYKIFDKHIKERHIKGGESTRRKYLKLKEG